ncbi:MAG: hypothetical protein HZA13_10470 [Nitrospirae bacterium]|nr:hypothetical protein [Nitrospirota bacterium]
MLTRFFIPLFIIALIQHAVVSGADARLIAEEEGVSAGLSADLYTTTINKAGKESISVAKIYRLGKRLRFESKESRTEEVSIYDFDLLKEMRVVPQDRVFFERKITRSFLIKAEREGLYAPDNPNIKIDRIRLKEDRTDNHPTVLYLVVRSMKTGVQTVARDYSMVWEATDLGNVPIKIVYPMSDFSTVIVEYRNVTMDKLDPSLFLPPPDFLSLSPF